MQDGTNAALDAFLSNAVKVCEDDVRISSLLVGGSAASRKTDRFSDLDLIVVCHDAAYQSVMAARSEIAGKLGVLLSSFTGEHVGEPRLLICLYDSPLLHVDLKFVTADSLVSRVERPLVALDKEGAVAEVLATGAAEWPTHQPEWFEDRFWIWIHYGVCKIARGELFEAIDLLSWIRSAVLGPMIAGQGGHRQRGVRHVELESPDYVDALVRTLSCHDQTDCWRALHEAVSLYLKLRAANPPPSCNRKAECAVRQYLADLSRSDSPIAGGD